jgi:hypothetical protein
MSTTSRDSDETAQRGPLDSEKALDLQRPSPARLPVCLSLGALVDVEKAPVLSDAGSNGTDWDGADDPGNPQNWPSWMRHAHVIPPALVSFSA